MYDARYIRVAIAKEHIYKTTLIQKQHKHLRKVMIRHVVCDTRNIRVAIAKEQINILKGMKKHNID